MEVQVTIPKRLVKYIEYIPTEVLPEILSEIVEKCIAEKHTKVEEVVVQNMVDTDSILSVIQQLQKVSTSSGVMSTVVEEELRSEMQHGLESYEELSDTSHDFSNIQIDSNDDFGDDFDELMSLMK